MDDQKRDEKEDSIWWTTNLTFAIQSYVEIGERKSVEGQKGYNTENLVTIDNHEVKIEFGNSDNPDENDDVSGMTISVYFYHALNKETERAFHCRVMIVPTISEIEKLRDYLDFLLKHNDTIHYR